MRATMDHTAPCLAALLILLLTAGAACAQTVWPSVVRKYPWGRQESALHLPDSEAGPGLLLPNSRRSRTNARSLAVRRAGVHEHGRGRCRLGLG